MTYMKKFLETLWARLEMNGKQLYDQQKTRAAFINMYEVQTKFIYGWENVWMDEDRLVVFKTKKQALTLPLESMLQDKLVEHFTKYKEKMGEDDPCTKKELQEFFEDGKAILKYFTSKLDKLYTKSGFELIAIEQRLNAEIKPGVNFIGFIDVLLKDKTTQDYIIIDLKTSTRGWNKYQKADKVKTSQMLLYKKFYSEKYDIPLDKIKVEYQILKRKLWEGADFVQPRISKFVPANGKPSMNMAWKNFMFFVDSVFGENGEIIQTEFPTNKGKPCDWCEFKQRGLCSAWN